VPGVVGLAEAKLPVHRVALGRHAGVPIGSPSPMYW
jgi:hypothetical protein